MNGIVPRNDDPIVREGCLQKVKILFDLLPGIAWKAKAIDLGAQRGITFDRSLRPMASIQFARNRILTSSALL